MKHLTLTIGLLLITLSSLFAQTPNVDRVHEHFNVATDLRNGELLTFATYTYIMNGEAVTRVDNAGQIDFSRTYFINGSPFVPWGAMDLGGRIIMEGAVSGSGEFIVAIDYNGNEQWARAYTEEIDAIGESVNGDILLASVVNGNSGPEYLLAELSWSDGTIVGHTRTRIPAFSSGGTAKVTHLYKNNGGYLALISQGVKTFTLSSDAGLAPQKLVHHSANALTGFEVRELRKGVNGDFYVVGIDEPGNAFFVGQMDVNQHMWQMQRIEVVNGSFDLGMAHNAPVSVESPNRQPYYHGGSWGSVTAIPGNAAFTFVGEVDDQNANREKAMVIQFDEYWNLNYSMLYNFGSNVGHANLIKRHREQITMVTTLGISGSIPRLLEYRMADDLLGCFSSHQPIETQNISMNRDELPFENSQNEFDDMEVDVNSGPNEFGSAQICPVNKLEEASGMELSDAGFVVYPNPSTGTAYLKAEGIAGSAVTVYDITGRVVETFIASGSGADAISGLKPGVYVVSLRTDAEVLTQKLIVQ